MTRLDRTIKERRDSDVQLVNWWLYFLPLSWVTIGICAPYLRDVRAAPDLRRGDRAPARGMPGAGAA